MRIGRVLTWRATAETKPCKTHRRPAHRNAGGYRIGESHHNSKLTDHDIDLIFELHETYRLSYAVIAVKFEVSKACIQGILTYRRRAQCDMG